MGKMHWSIDQVIRDSEDFQGLRRSLHSIATKYVNGYEVDSLLPYNEAKCVFERSYYRNHLMLNDGKIGDVTKKIEMSKTYLHTKIGQLFLERKMFRPNANQYRPDLVLAIEHFIITNTLAEWFLKKPKMEEQKDKLVIALFKDIKRGRYTAKRKTAMTYFIRNYLRENLERYRTPSEMSRHIGRSFWQISRLLKYYNIKV